MDVTMGCGGGCCDGLCIRPGFDGRKCPLPVCWAFECYEQGPNTFCIFTGYIGVPIRFADKDSCHCGIPIGQPKLCCCCDVGCTRAAVVEAEGEAPAPAAEKPDIEVISLSMQR